MPSSAICIYCLFCLSVKRVSLLRTYISADGAPKSSLLLGQVGIPVVVLEREGGPRQEGSAITFWPNAFRVLDALGIAAPIRETHPLVHRCALLPVLRPLKPLLHMPGYWLCSYFDRSMIRSLGAIRVTSPSTLFSLLSHCNEQTIMGTSATMKVLYCNWSIWQPL